MMRVILWCLPLFLLLSFSAKKKRVFIPPGTVKISDTLYFDKSEVTNLSWHEYLYWLKTMHGKESKEYKAALPDTSVWLFDGMTSNQPWQSSFSNVKHFNNLPICGITHEQAIAFCKWRTERVRYFVNLSDRYIDCEFSYRLPTGPEWEFVADGSSEVFSNMKPPVVLKANATTTLLNVSWPANLNYGQNLDFLHTTNVDSYKPNRFGVYDMTGNVAEMLLEKGLCKGGGFYHNPEEARNGKYVHYEKPAAWLGFRCVCVVSRSNKSS